MRYIPIEKTEQDMILARSVYDNTGRVLLSCGTVLTDEYIDKLYERGLPGIYIEDKLAEDIEIEEAISEELRNEGAEALRSHECGKENCGRDYTESKSYTGSDRSAVL